jgi:hypothetical protein
MKTQHPCNVPRPRGGRRLTPLHGQAKGRTWQGKTTHPSVYRGMRTSTEGHRTPIRICPGPPSKVRASAMSRDEEDPGVSRGPVLTRVQALPFTSRSGGNPLLVAHDISHRVEPDVKPCSPYIYRGEDAPPATALTGDVPSQHLIRLVPSTGRRCQGHPAGCALAGSAGEQCARARQRTVLSLLQEASPARRRYTDLG